MQYNPHTIIMEMKQFKCSTCNNIIWMFPKTQEEADNHICLDCVAKQAENKLETKALIIPIKGEESPQDAKQTSKGTGKKRRKTKNVKKNSKSTSATSSSGDRNSIRNE